MCLGSSFFHFGSVGPKTVPFFVCYPGTTGGVVGVETEGDLRDIYTSRETDIEINREKEDVEEEEEGGKGRRGEKDFSIILSDVL